MAPEHHPEESSRSELEYPATALAVRALKSSALVVQSSSCVLPQELLLLLAAAIQSRNSTGDKEKEKILERFLPASAPS